jgi:hypothetical protein
MWAVSDTRQAKACERGLLAALRGRGGLRFDHDDSGGVDARTPSITEHTTHTTRPRHSFVEHIPTHVLCSLFLD